MVFHNIDVVEHSWSTVNIESTTGVGKNEHIAVGHICFHIVFGHIGFPDPVAVSALICFDMMTVFGPESGVRLKKRLGFAGDFVE